MNEYYQEFLKHSSRRGCPACNDYCQARSTLASKYAWAVPTDEALEVLAGVAPILEIGAGTGYWASLLRERGVDILAYDTNPYENHWCNGSWGDVLIGGTEQAGLHPDRALFLCWPPYNTSMAGDALKLYTGSTLVLVGEAEGGCTGGDDLWDQLDADNWCEVKYLDLPNWPGIHDNLSVWHRGGIPP